MRADKGCWLIMLKKRTASGLSHVFLYGLPGCGRNWQLKCLSGAVQYSLHELSLCPPPGTPGTTLTSNSHFTRNRRCKSSLWRSAKYLFSWGADSDDMTSLRLDRQIFFSPPSCWLFGPALSIYVVSIPSRGLMYQSPRVRIYSCGMFSSRIDVEIP
jgi:hypothetical protein